MANQETTPAVLMKPPAPRVAEQAVVRKASLAAADSEGAKDRLTSVVAVHDVVNRAGKFVASMRNARGKDGSLYILVRLRLKAR